MGSVNPRDSSGGDIDLDATNASLAISYWYTIAGVLGSTLLLRVLEAIHTRMRLQVARSRTRENPTKPRNVFLKSYASAKAILRELTAPELYFTNPTVSWLSPPSLGRSLLLAVYWGVIIYMLCWQSIVDDMFQLQRISFRASFVSISQVPLVYLLASKSSIIGFFTGSSHERLNWFHRWAARTLLVTITIHGGLILRVWMQAGDETFIAQQLNLMPQVKNGIGAWLVLVWTVLSSLTPIRRLSYEIFVLQHFAAAGILLWLLYVHVPPRVQYNIWFAIAAIVSDKVVLFFWSLSANIRPGSPSGIGERRPKIIGHHATLRALDDETSEIVIKDIPFKWEPGQHIYLRAPAFGPLQAHPFTISNAYKQSSSSATVNDIRLVIQAQSGFTRRLHQKASAVPQGDSLGLTTIVTGPFGRPPTWNSFETLILISASTGASFTMPILESILSDQGNGCTTRIDVLLTVRRRCGVENYLPQLKEALSAAEAVGLTLNITAAITSESESDIAAFNDKMHSLAPREGCRCGAAREASNRSSSGSVAEGIQEEKSNPSNQDTIAKVEEVPASTCACDLGQDKITYTSGRPDIKSFILGPVEAAGGETCVAVCGGRYLVATAKNKVASLSYARGVHKGTGAQGIALYSETLYA